MKKLQIALTDTLGMAPYAEYLAKRGHHVRVVSSILETPEECLQLFKDKGDDVIVAVNEKFPEPVLDALKNSLRLIARFGLGHEKIDIPAATKRGICVTNAAGAMAGAVAETALILMLECGRGFTRYDRDMHAGLWEKGGRGRQLTNKTVGIVGFGHVGRRLARYITGFDCEILTFDPYCDAAILAEHHVKRVSMDELARQSDVLAVCCPLTNETRGLVSRAIIMSMKPDAYLVNVARGPVVDMDALAEALQRGRIAGAGLDVYMREPLEADHPLRTLDNVVLTPHIASQTFEAFEETALSIDRTLEMFARGEIPDRCLNRDYVHYQVNRIY